MNITYIETFKDREEGVKNLNKIIEIYGSRILFLLLAIAVLIVSILEIIFDVNIGIGYLGIFLSSIFIWHLGIKYHIDKKKLMRKEDLVYKLDLDNNLLILNEKEYSIKELHHFKDYFLFTYSKGYLSVSKKNADFRIIEKYSIVLEKPRTLLDTLFWAFIGILILKSYNYFWG